MKEDCYVIGTGRSPEWCRNYLMPFRKMNGSTGWEFHGKRTVFILKAGDELIRSEGKIIVKEKGKR